MKIDMQIVETVVHFSEFFQIFKSDRNSSRSIQSGVKVDKAALPNLQRVTCKNRSISMTNSAAINHDRPTHHQTDL